METLGLSKKWIAVAAGVLLPMVAAEASAIGPASELYYQVTYADGGVRDLSEVPTTKKDIRRVVRISRFERGFRGYEMLATGPVALTVQDCGRTARHELTWNGRAWVARRETRRRRLTATPQQMSNVLRDERSRVAQILRSLRRRLKDHDHAVAEAERRLDKTKGSDEEAAAAEALAKAAELRKAVLAAIELYEVQLKALTDAAGSRSTGKLNASGRPPPDDKALGLLGEIRQARALPHRVQVWRLPDGRGRRTISVAMAHPEAGPFGAFHYVAYADTDGDGLPDKAIGMSPPAAAAEPGGWSNWQFTTDEPVVFVGNAWTHPDTTVYFARRPDDFVREHWRGLSSDVYVSGFFGGIPRRNYPYAPYLTNIRVSVTDPFGPVESGGSRIIVR